MNTTFRCRRYVGWLGLACTAGTGAFVGLLYMALHEECRSAPPCGDLGLVLISAGPIALLGLGGPYMIAYAIRHRLTIGGGNVELTGVFGTRQIALADVAEARWRMGKDGGRLTLKGRAHELRIDFGGYPPDDARRLIRFFRLGLAEDVQRGWEEYWNSTWRLFDAPDPARREEFAEKTRALRARMLAWILLGAVLCVAAAVVVWLYTGNARGFAMLLLYFPVLLLFALLVRADRGRIAEKTVMPPQRLPIAMVAGGMLFLMLVMLVLTIFMILGAIGASTVRILLYSGTAVAGAAILAGAVLSAFSSSSRNSGLVRAKTAAARLAEQEYMREEEKKRR
jgi:hypothetical protein